MSDVVRTPRTPQEAAEHLAAALDNNTKALGRVQRRYRLVIALVIAIALTLAVAIKFNYDGNVSRCKGGNELRSQIDDKWGAIVGFLETAGTGDNEEGRAFLTLLDEDLEKRDCSDTHWFGS